MAIRIGTRGSKLARWQANWVASELAKYEIETEIVYLKTLGDVKTGPIGSVGSQGVFTKEIQSALLDNSVDLAVHSLKDLPTDHIDGLALSTVPLRAPCGDALISPFDSLESLPPKATVATGSMRRRAQLLSFRSDLQVCDVRGNVETRLQKLHDGDFDAMVLAEAGLKRLGLEENIRQIIPKTIMLPAVGQGALGLETREDDVETHDAIRCLHHQETHWCVLAERSMLRSLRGGCLAPVGAWARLEQDELVLDGVVLDEMGVEKVLTSIAGPPANCEELGISAAHELVVKGADRLLASARD